jgi:hypothetical protein
MNKRKYDHKTREAPDFLKRVTDYIETSWPVRLWCWMEDYLSDLLDKGGPTFTERLIKFIGYGVITLNLTRAGLWLMFESGIL